MKKLLIAILISIPLFASAADEISLTASGNGSTQDAAVKSALRNAIEQAYGAFISTNTQVLNNKLVKDEIVSLSQGVVKSYNIESSAYIKERNVFFVTVRAVVSISSMASFVNEKTSSGVKVNMGVFDANIKLAELNKKAEKRIMENLVDFIATVPHLWSYRMALDEPFVSDMYEGLYQINGFVYVLKNENTIQILNLIKETLLSLSLSAEERANYDKWGLNYYTVRSISFSQNDLFFRNPQLPFVGMNELFYKTDGIRYFANDILLLYAFFGFTIADNMSNPTRYCFYDYLEAKSCLRGNLIEMDETFTIYSTKFKQTPKITDYKYKKPKYDSEKAEALYRHLEDNTHAMYSNMQSGTTVRCIPIRIYIPISKASQYTGFEVKEKKIVIKDAKSFYDGLPEGISVYGGIDYQNIKLPNGKLTYRE